MSQRIIKYLLNEFTSLRAGHLFLARIFLDFRYVFLGSKTSCCVASVQPNHKYMFRVQAQNVAGVSIVCVCFLIY